MNASAVVSAIRDAARNQIVAAEATVASPLTVSRLIRQTTYDRFLCRIFSENSESFVLKGGAGMLARVPSSRTTRDVDLSGQSSIILEAAVEELVRLAATDLEDHFTFELKTRNPQPIGAMQPMVSGTRLTFAVSVGTAAQEALHVDLTLGQAPTARPERRAPANRLVIPRLISFDYLLYSVVDQIADKVCAIRETHGLADRHSSREKDLVDLAILSLHEAVDSDQLRIAIATETALRRMAPAHEFEVPPDWGAGYERLARPLPILEGHRTIDAAVELVSRLLNPVLQKSLSTGTWDPSTLDWRES